MEINKIYKSSQPPLQHRVADKGPGCSWQQVYRQIERLPLKHGDPAAALADCCLTVLLLSGGMSLRAAAGHFEAPEPEGSMPRTRHRKCSGITDLRYVRSERNCPPPPYPFPKHSPKTPRRNTHRGPTTWTHARRRTDVCHAFQTERNLQV